MARVRRRPHRDRPQDHRPLTRRRLHLHWLCAYDPEQNGSAPLGSHRDFADARKRLRDWVTASGTKRDHDRPTRHTIWPGEEPGKPVEDSPTVNRDAEFVEFVLADVRRRREAEEAFYSQLAAEADHE